MLWPVRFVLFSLLPMLAAAPALGQAQKKPAQTDQELVTRLHELTRAKGIYVQNLGADFCRRLGARPIGNCEAYKAEFPNNGRPLAIFYSLNEGRKGQVRLFITSNLEQGYVDDYRVGPDGKLERAARRRGDATSHLSVLDGADGFKRAMDYLRERQDDLAGLPDARLVEDGSCPEGKIKRVPSDPQQAVCLDRDAPEAKAKAKRR
jgi:hypothetical protein